jgi:hypothetical protein
MRWCEIATWLTWWNKKLKLSQTFIKSSIKSLYNFKNILQRQLMRYLHQICCMYVAVIKVFITWHWSVFLRRAINYCKCLPRSFTWILGTTTTWHSTIIFHQDGAPPHCGLHVREVLKETFPDRWIGRGGPIVLSPCSDFTPLNYFLWGYVKDIMYWTKVRDITNRKQRLTDAIATTDEGMLQWI